MLKIKESTKDLKVVRLDGGGIPIYEYKGNPFTGIVFIEHDNGFPAWEAEYKEGYQEGWIKTYHKNGRLKQVSNNHNNDVIEGTFQEWDENGNLVESF